jgi:hypothetical protein
MAASRQVLDTVNQILQLLVNCDYDAIEKVSNGVRLSATEIKQAVDQYGRSLEMPPEDSELDIVEIEGGKGWSVRCDLWTKEEGRSDLTLELTIVNENNFRVEVDDIHVL